jgi:uncharacterized caspase-like protein
VRDAGLAALHRSVNAYTRRVRAAGPGAVALLYYSGHGAADAGGSNYLIPVDVGSAEEGVLWDPSLRLTEITRKLKAEAGDAIHFVVFDARRNVLKLRRAGSRALFEARGFAPMAQERGMLIPTPRLRARRRPTGAPTRRRWPRRSSSPAWRRSACSAPCSSG